MTIEKMNVDLELRAIQEKISKGEISVADAQKKVEEIKVRKRELDAQEALASVPLQKRTNSFDDLKNAIMEKRGITMSGNGAINQISEIVKIISDKTPLLEKIGYIYGANASNNIPLLDPGLASPTQKVEGFTAGSTDATAALDFKVITPIGWTSTLPVSWEALNLLSANLEAELPGLFAGVFGQTMHLLATNTLFAAGSVHADNKIAVKTTGGYPDIMDIANLSFQMLDKNFIAPSLLMNSQTLTGIMGSATDTIGKIYAEELARTRSINGIPVVLTGKAHTDKAAGKTLVIGGDLNSLKMAIASELMISPKTKVGEINTYFDGSLFFNCGVAQPKNFFALVGKA